MVDYSVPDDFKKRFQESMARKAERQEREDALNHEAREEMRRKGITPPRHPLYYWYLGEDADDDIEESGFIGRIWKNFKGLIGIL